MQLPFIAEKDERRFYGLKRREVMWTVRRCGRVGHVVSELNPEDLLASQLVDKDGEKTLYLCLRCGSWVSTDNPAVRDLGAETLADVPLVLRGAHGRKLALLKILAVERAFKGTLLIIAALSAFLLVGKHEAVLGRLKYLIDIGTPLANELNWNADKSKIVHTVLEALNHSSTAYLWLTFLFALYAIIQLVEGIGLWGGWRWAEYLACIATAAFIPLEVYELINHVTVFKILTLTLNIVVVVYLLVKGRLFGIKGGHTAWLNEVRDNTLLANVLTNQNRSPSEQKSHEMI